MSHSPLTAKYRPQNFADVAGQSTIKAVLSRAAAEDRVAPAYLFSGTRGVGKTTLARIFAKALNCVHAPGAEPCNNCEQCQKITQGIAVDVVEIDGASNRGIDDAKRLKEAIGYAPMEGRYKVFIIDEAHMLTREAFNALLKTLEEPPARVTFIMATTEAHKFPITIVSRCQHFIFKRLTEKEISDHLVRILGLENVSFEQEAVTLIARRAAGSVRDAMSLLGQVLALGNDSLREADVRGFLGLAGHELFFELLSAMQKEDCVAVSTVLRGVLEQGLDLGFFLRELTTVWRNLFLLRQSGKAAMSLIDLPETEAAQWFATAEGFALSHIHACWQMTLEGQRRVLTSLEPAMALELLLLNLTMMPRLLGMSQVSRKAPLPTATTTSAATASATASAASVAPADTATHPVASAHEAPAGDDTEPERKSLAQPVASVGKNDAPIINAAPQKSEPSVAGNIATASAGNGYAGGEDNFEEQAFDDALSDAFDDLDMSEASGTVAPSSVPPVASSATHSFARPVEGSSAPLPATSPSSFAPVSAPVSAPASASTFASASGVSSRFAGKRFAVPPLENLPAEPRTWQSFVDYCKQNASVTIAVQNIFDTAKAVQTADALRITPQFARQCRRLNEDDIQMLFQQFFGDAVLVSIGSPQKVQKSKADLCEEMKQHPTVQRLVAFFDAQVIDSEDAEGLFQR